MNTIRVRVDDENNAERWWDAMDAEYPELARRLRREDEVELDKPTFDAIASLPGFGDGPEYAPTALIRCDD